MQVFWISLFQFCEAPLPSGALKIARKFFFPDRMEFELAIVSDDARMESRFACAIPLDVPNLPLLQKFLERVSRRTAKQDFKNTGDPRFSITIPEIVPVAEILPRPGAICL